MIFLLLLEHEYCLAYYLLNDEPNFIVTKYLSDNRTYLNEQLICMKSPESMFSTEFEWIQDDENTFVERDKLEQGRWIVTKKTTNNKFFHLLYLGPNTRDKCMKNRMNHRMESGCMENQGVDDEDDWYVLKVLIGRNE